MGLLLQIIATRVGIIARKDLAQVCICGVCACVCVGECSVCKGGSC